MTRFRFLAKASAVAVVATAAFVLLFSLAARADPRWDLLNAASKPVFLFSLIAMALCLLARDSRLALLALAASVAMLLNWKLGPQAEWKDPVVSSNRILMANVWNKNSNTGPLEQIIKSRKPDLVILIEARADFYDLALGMRDVYPHVLYVDEPGSLDPNADRAKRLLAFSRTPLNWAHRPTERGLANYAMADWQTPSGEQMRFMMTHITRPWPYSEDSEQLDQANEVSQVSAEYGAEMIAGDFNAVANSAIMSHIHSTTGLSPIEGVPGTFHSDAPEMFRISIDHILLARDWKVSRREVLEDIDSDHLPILIEIWK